MSDPTNYGADAGATQEGTQLAPLPGPSNDKPAPNDMQMIDRDKADPPDARAELVKTIAGRVAKDKAHWAKRFEIMKECGDFVRSKQWSKDDKDDRYVANIIQRHVASKVSALYAKNPRMIASRRDKMDFSVWDEKPESLQAAMQAMQQGQMTPGIMALLQDVAQGYAEREMLDKLARTLQIVYQYQLDEQEPPFKLSMKQMVRRTVINGVGYVKACYYRDMEPRPEIASQIASIEEQLGLMEQLNADIADGETPDDGGEIEELRVILKTLHSQPLAVKREGLFYDYPQSWTIIPDIRTQNIRGWVGSRWITQEYHLTPEQIEQIYKVDVRSGYTPYTQTSGKVEIRQVGDGGSIERKDTDLCCVWEHYDRQAGVVYVVCDGWADFLKEPGAPDLTLKRFFPIFALAFNESEHETDPYPQSDVELLMPMQKEYNRARQGLREHRHAARPKTVARQGSLTDEDKEKIQAHPNNALIEIQGLGAGQKVEDLLQAWKYPGIDPAMYDTSYVFDDMQRTVGSQEANLGGTSDSTATEASIAEASRMGTLQSNVDDIDDFLTELARTSGNVLLLELDIATVQKIAGRGAVWPQLAPEDVVNEVFIEAEMGSSGRPNKTVELQNFERLAPTLMQLPGISPFWLARETLKRMDDRMDLDDAVIGGMPSIQAINAMMAKAGGGGAAQLAPPDQGGAPQAAQGPAGAINAPSTKGNEPPPSAAPPSVSATPPAITGSMQAPWPQAPAGDPAQGA